jgi:hypothetical protein
MLSAGAARACFSAPTQSVSYFSGKGSRTIEFPSGPVAEGRSVYAVALSGATGDVAVNGYLVPARDCRAPSTSR